MGEFRVIGTRVPRTDAAEKVTGRALYTADLVLPGMIYGVFVRSPYAHARIKRIDTSKAEKVPGVVAIITQEQLSRDIALVIEEEVHSAQQIRGLFASDKVRYYGEKVALVGAESLEAAKEAASLVEVEYEPLPAVIDPREAVQEGAPLVWEDREPVIGPNGERLFNVVAERHHAEGDVEQGFAESDYLFEDEFYVHRVHQSYIEPQAAIATVDERGKITVWTSTQGHFVVRSNIARSLGIPLHRIRVIGMTIGGGFGAKFGGIVDIYAVLLALFTRRPAKIVYTREGRFAGCPPRPRALHPHQNGCESRWNDCRPLRLRPLECRRRRWRFVGDGRFCKALQHPPCQVGRLRGGNKHATDGSISGTRLSASPFCGRNSTEPYRR